MKRSIPWHGLLIMYTVGITLLLPVWLLLDWSLWQLFVGLAIGLTVGTGSIWLDRRLEARRKHEEQP